MKTSLFGYVLIILAALAMFPLCMIVGVGQGLWTAYNHWWDHAGVLWGELRDRRRLAKKVSANQPLATGGSR